ncbi:MAP kinase-activated protein kinase 2 (Fragment) [Seminavis robusta]|uniref:MAP kinase-activated protein kinase 2 n=1 Tax=Seminavis robusta TaxID=568900 RepID=A0A9N8HIP3_9STRA
MPVAASAAYPPTATYTQPHHHQAPPQPMVGYGHGSHHHSPSPASVAMDMDTGNSHSRTKYSSSSGNNPSLNMQPSPRPASHRSLREDPDHNNSKSRSARSSSRDARRSSRSRKSHGGATSSSSNAVQFQHPSSSSSRRVAGGPYSQQSQQPPPQSAQTPLVNHPAYHKNPGTPNPDNLQPTFPPPAVTNDSPTQNHVGEVGNPSSRRPAYLLHRDLVIGKGSYGQVCIASRGEPEGHQSNRSGKRKKFACKCVMLRNDPKYIAKLQEEVNVLRELRGHENVIRLYDVFCVDNELFIITELGRGGDLFHLLTTHPKHGVTEAYAAKTVAEMLSSVAFLHSRSICHRDLKLENWVLESGKDVWSPLKLIDFGLSTHFTRGQRLSRVVGSSYYVAPEVLKKSYTEACDLWSLGVIVYMLLSGAPPFYGKNDEAIKASIVQGEYTFPHELFRDVSDEAMAFVSTLLSYNIEYRYTAEQALTHPWLAANCDAEALQRAKDGARGIGIDNHHHSAGGSRPEPMQL